jgi:CspA family cold shock protein
MKGKVSRWLLGRGYGFIKPDDGENDVFVHHSELKGAVDLEEGQMVEFEVQDSPRGPRAVNVTIIEE